MNRSIAPGWRFSVSEFRMGVYLISGKSDSGGCIEVQSSALYDAVWQSAKDAIAMNAKLGGEFIESCPHTIATTKLLEEFPKALRNIVIDEVIMGNPIADSWTNFGSVVKLRNRFVTNRSKVTNPLFYRKIDDPHYWYEELGIQDLDYVVAAGSA